MAQKRSGNPYIWVTWLTRLMVGESSCEWATWFRAQHDGCSWEKAQRGFGQSYNMAESQMKHTALIATVRDAWEGQGYKTFTENQNAFRLRGKTATLGGKADLLALRGNGGTIMDVKSGKPGPSHIAQVMVYMYAIPKAQGQYRGMVLDGQVVYPDHVVDIPASAVDQEFIGNMGRLICRVSAAEPARRVPSLTECRFCDISSAECPDRVEDKSLNEGEGETLDF